MPRYIMQEGELVEVVRGPRQPSVFPHVRGDIRPYVSPITGREVDGRAARREDLARSGCREVDPSEGLKSGGVYTASMARRLGVEQVAPPPAPQHVLDWRAGRGMQREALDMAPIMPLAGT